MRHVSPPRSHVLQRGSSIRHDLLVNVRSAPETWLRTFPDKSFLPHNRAYLVTGRGSAISASSSTRRRRESNDSKEHAKCTRTSSSTTVAFLYIVVVFTRRKASGAVLSAAMHWKYRLLRVNLVSLRVYGTWSWRRFPLERDMGVLPVTHSSRKESSRNSSGKHKMKCIYSTNTSYIFILNEAMGVLDVFLDGALRTSLLLPPLGIYV